MIGEEIVGGNGQVKVDETGIIIKRKGLVAAIKFGAVGDKLIPYSSIKSVQFKKPDWATIGFIQFGILGGRESVGSVFAANSDENSVTFMGPKLQDFLRLKGHVERQMSSETSEKSRTDKYSLADEIGKLDSLRERGILTEDEFLYQKAKLLAD